MDSEGCMNLGQARTPTPRSVHARVFWNDITSFSSTG